jgi:hypothetical protein
VIAPDVVIRPIAPLRSVNHRAPSGPAVMASAPPLGSGTGNAVITPAVVMRPILLLVPSKVNHRAPSGPATMPRGVPLAELLIEAGSGYSVKTCAPTLVIHPNSPIAAAASEPRAQNSPKRACFICPLPLNDTWSAPIIASRRRR